MNGRKDAVGRGDPTPPQDSGGPARPSGALPAGVALLHTTARRTSRLR